jgi:hypothetical protein
VASPAPPARRHALMAGAILVACLVAYLPAFSIGLWGDDLYFLEQCRATDHDPAHLVARWVDPFNRPGAQVAYYLEYRLWGLRSQGYAADTIALHALSAMMLYLLLLGLVGAGPAAGAGLLFAAGLGSYGKAVLSGASMGDMLAAVFLLGTCHAAAAAARASTPAGRWLGPWAVAAVLALGLACKEAAIMAWIVAAGLVWLVRPGWRNLARVLAPAALVVVAYLAAQVLAGSGVAHSLRRDPGVFLALPTQAVRLGTLMFLPVLPGSTLLERAPGLVRDWVAAIHAARPVLGWITLAAAAWVAWRGRGVVRWLLASCFLLLLPFGLVPMVGDWLELRYTYLPSLMFCALVALAIRWLWARRAPAVRWLTAAVLVLAVASDLALIRGLAAKYRHLGQSPQTRRELRELGKRPAPAPDADR